MHWQIPSAESECATSRLDTPLARTQPLGTPTHTHKDLTHTGPRRDQNKTQTHRRGQPVCVHMCECDPSPVTQDEKGEETMRIFYLVCQPHFGRVKNEIKERNERRRKIKRREQRRHLSTPPPPSKLCTDEKGKRKEGRERNKEESESPVPSSQCSDYRFRVLLVYSSLHIG